MIGLTIVRQSYTVKNRGNNMEFKQNLTEMRLASLQNGNADMTLDEINAEIAAARDDRKKYQDTLTNFDKYDIPKP